MCNPMDSSPPGSSVHRILQARVLEWSSIYGHVDFGMKRMAYSFLPWSQHTQRAMSGSLLCHLSGGHRPTGLGSETVREGLGEGVLRLSSPPTWLVSNFLVRPASSSGAPGRPGTPVFLPGESQGRGSLVGCRLWGRTELDTTERLHFLSFLLK